MNEYIWIIGLMILGLIGGVVGTKAYEGYTHHKTLDGLWLKGFNQSEAEQKANNMDSSNEWVCVNVDNKMSYQKIIDTCIHEASHELFSRECTQNVTKCMEIAGK